MAKVGVQRTEKPFVHIQRSDRWPPATQNRARTQGVYMKCIGTTTMRKEGGPMKKLMILGLALITLACGAGGNAADSTTTSITPTSSEGPTTTVAESTTTVSAPETTQTTGTTVASATTATTAPETTSTTLTADETISPSGFWEVEIGQTLAENEARIGFPLDDLGGEPDSCLVLALPEVGGIHFIAASLTGDPVDGRQNLVIGRVSADSPGWTTENGIEVGMSVGDAETALGETIIDRQPHSYVEGGEYIVVGPEDARYVFETDGETVTALHAGIEPVVSYVEACS
jgi:hypothetical protein